MRNRAHDARFSRSFLHDFQRFWTRKSGACKLHAIEGRVAFKSYDHLLKTDIDFPTRSDALLAGLLFTHNMSPTLMKEVLAVVLDPNFDVREITLRTVPDFYHTLRQRRTEQLDDLACHAASSIPPVIVDGVLNAIVNDLDELDNNFHIVRDPRSTINCIRNLSLVQRNWVQPARRVLSRHLHIASELDPHYLGQMRTSLFGPWCQRTTIDCLQDGCKKASDPLATVQSLTAHYLTGVRTLVLSLSCFLSRPSSCFHAEALSYFTVLEDLQISPGQFNWRTAKRVYDPTEDRAESMDQELLTVVATLPCLRRFTTLCPNRNDSMLNMTGTQPTMLPDDFAVLANSVSLETIQLTWVGYAVSAVRFKREVYGRFRLDAANCDLTEVSEYHINLELSDCLPRLRHLGFTSNSHGWALIKQAASLKSITVMLETSDRKWGSFPSYLTSSTPHVTIQVNCTFEGLSPFVTDCLRTAWSAFDQALAEHVRRSLGALRYLRVDAYIGRGSPPYSRLGKVAAIERPAAVMLQETTSACRDGGVFFVLDKYYSSTF